MELQTDEKSGDSVCEALPKPPIEALPSETGELIAVAERSRSFVRSGTFVSEAESEVSKKFENCPRKTVASSTVSKIRGTPRPNNVAVKASHASVVSKTSSKQNVGPVGMTLPHILGSIPKYMRRSSAQMNTKSRPQTVNDEALKSRLPRSCNLSKAPSQISEVNVSDEDRDHQLKSQIKEMNAKALESKNKIFALNQKVDVLKKQLADCEKQAAEATSTLKEKTDKLAKADALIARFKRDNKKSSTETEQKTKGQEEMLLNLQKVNEEALKKLQEKEEMCQQLVENLGKITNEKSVLENMVKSLQQNQGDGSHNQNVTNLERKIATVETQLKTRVSEIAFLKDETSMKTKSLETVKSNHSDGSGEIMNIKREICDLKNSLKNSQLEVQSAKSKLNDERHKNHRIENLLQLREEYVKNLQDSDEILRSRWTLQARDVGKLREKIEQEKQFKTSTNEELQILHNTLSQQDFEIKNLKIAIENKDRKVKKWHDKLLEFGVSCP